MSKSILSTLDFIVSVGYLAICEFFGMPAAAERHSAAWPALVSALEAVAAAIVCCLEVVDQLQMRSFAACVLNLVAEQAA